MKLKKFIRRVFILAPMLICLTACGTKDSPAADKDEKEYPKIAYIDGSNYYGTDKICENVPRKAPDGFIETFVPKEIMPDAYNSANFGSEQGKLEFIFLEDKELIIHIGENWYYFEEKAE